MHSTFIPWYRVLRTVAKLILGRGKRLSYGQFGEDAIVQTTLKKSQGMYVDVGAYDPVLYSNTYALYRRGWRGIVIDPNPDVERPFRVIRPRDTFVRCGIGTTEGLLSYHRFSDGAYNTFNTEEAASRRTEGRSPYLGSVSVPILSLSNVLHEHKVSAIDYLNVDVEGMDLEVLMSHNWSIRPRLITVEDLHFKPDHPEQSRTACFLTLREYALVGYAGHTLVFSDVQLTVE